METNATFMLEDGEIFDSSDEEQAESESNVNLNGLPHNLPENSENISVCDDDVTKIASKTNNCAVCEMSLAKYRCPSCELRTCSLKCCSNHKVATGCDGSVKRSRMVPLGKFDNLTLLNDYRFLEEAARICTNSSNELKTAKMNAFKRDHRKSNRLSKECFRRACKLQFLPTYFEKSQRNTSHFDPIADTIFWKLTWVFVDADSLKVETERNPETVTIATLLKQIVYPKPMSDYVALAKSLKSYSECDLLELKCFIKVENNRWTNDRRYYELDLRSNIKDNLRNRILIEYPFIYVTVPNGSHVSTFKVLSEETKNDILAKRIWEKTSTVKTFDERMRLIKEAEKVIRPPPNKKFKNVEDAKVGNQHHHVEVNDESSSSTRDTASIAHVETTGSVESTDFKPLKRLLPMKNLKKPGLDEKLQQQQHQWQQRQHQQKSRQNFKEYKQEVIKRLAEQLAHGQNMNHMGDHDDDDNSFLMKVDDNECRRVEHETNMAKKSEIFEGGTTFKNRFDAVDNVKGVGVKTNFFGILGDEDGEISDNDDNDSESS